MGRQETTNVSLNETDDPRDRLFARALGNGLDESKRRVPAWKQPKNVAAIAFLNRRFTLEQRLAKFREEALEAALEVTRDLDRGLDEIGPRGDTLGEIADVIVTLDSLLSRHGDNTHLLAAVDRAYTRLRGRIAAGEFGLPP